MLKKLLLLSCCIMVLSNSANTIKAKESDQYKNYSIKSVRKLEKELQKIKTKKDKEILLKKTKPEVLEKHLEKLTEESLQAVEQIENDVQTQKEADKIARESDLISSISINEKNDEEGTYNKETEIKLENGCAVKFISEDKPEQNLLTDLLQGTMYCHSLIGPKNYGDRRFTGVCELDYALYPKAELRMRIGYNINKKKKIYGRYIKSYNDSSENVLSGQTVTHKTPEFTKKASNKTNVSGKGIFYGKFKVVGKTALTYKYQLNINVKVLNYYSKSARLEHKTSSKIL